MTITKLDEGCWQVHDQFGALRGVFRNWREAHRYRRWAMRKAARHQILKLTDVFN